jgi:hypothetical protein
MGIIGFNEILFFSVRLNVAAINKDSTIFTMFNKLIDNCSKIVFQERKSYKILELQKNSLSLLAKLNPTEKSLLEYENNLNLAL